MKQICRFCLMIILSINAVVNAKSLSCGWSIGTSSISYQIQTYNELASCQYFLYVLGSFSFENGVWIQKHYNGSGVADSSGEYFGASYNYMLSASCGASGWNPTLAEINSLVSGLLGNSQELYEAQQAYLLIQDGIIEEFLNIFYPSGSIDQEEFDFFMDLTLPEKDPFSNKENVAEGAEPVYLSNGEFGYSVTDMVIPNRGIPIVISRTYGSKREYNGPYGFGWDMNYNMKIRPLVAEDEVESVVLLDGKGARREYTKETSSEKYVLPDDRSNHILSNGDTATYPFTLIERNGIKYDFDQNGNLSLISDKNNNTLTFQYSTEPQEIKGYSRFFLSKDENGPSGQRDVVVKEYLLQKITSSLGHEVWFVYYNDSEVDGSKGLLKNIIDVLDLADPTNPTKNRIWIYKYDWVVSQNSSQQDCSQYNNLVSVTSPQVDDPQNPGTPSQSVTTYTYTNLLCPQAITSIVDPEGQSTQEPYLENNYGTNLNDLRSVVETQNYDPTDNSSDALYEFNYNSDNNRVILGSREKTTYQTTKQSKSYTVTTYNDAGQTVSETVASNPIAGQPGAIYQAYTTSYEYNQYNEVKNVILPKRNCVEYIPDYLDGSNGFNLESMTVIQRPECDVLPFNGTSDYVQVTDGGAYAFNGADFSIAFWVKRLQHSETGNLFEEVVLDKRDGVGDGWCLKINSSNQLVLSINAVDVTSTTAVTDSNWHYIVVSVDNGGDGQIYIDGGIAEGNQTIGTQTLDIASDLYMGRCSYSAGAYLKGSLDEVMLINRKLSRDQSDISSDCYSIFGLSEDTQGLVGCWKIDSSDTDTSVHDSSTSHKDGTPARNTSLMVADGKVPGEIRTVSTFVQHNGLDYVRTITDAKGRHVTYRYDFDTNSSNPGNLVDMYIQGVEYYQRETGTLVPYMTKDFGETGAVPAVHFTYDTYGQVDTITTAEGLVTKYVYYPDDYAILAYRGRLYQLIVDYGNTSHLNITTVYDYDTMGHVNRVTQDTTGLNIASETLYNAMDQLVEITHPVLDGQTAIYKTVNNYTKNGKLWRVHHSVTDGGTTTQTQLVEYGYNLLDNLKTITDSLGNTTEMNYDDNENVISTVDPIGEVDDYQTNIAYDFRDLKETVTDAEGNETHYTYNANGNLKTITDAKNQVTQYNYDVLDRLTGIIYPDNSTESYAYDIAGSVIAKETRKGDMIYFDYDAMNRQVRQIIDDSTTLNVLVTDDSGTTSGNWEAQTSALGKQGSSYLTCDDVADVYSFQTSVDDESAYTVYMWWPKIATADTVTVRIKDNSTTLATLTVNQAQKSAQWVKLATSGYTFSSGTAVVEVVSQGSGKVTAADAVRLVPASFSVTEFCYDIAGRVLQVNKDSQLIDYFYDSLGRVEDVLDTNNRDVQYVYDNLGRRTRLTYPGDGTDYITYAYDKMSRLTDIKDSGGNVIAHYDYDQLSRRTALYYNYDGDAAYNETGVDGVIRYDYEDKVTNPQTENNLGNRLESVSHDINNDSTNDLTYAYTYDAVGNCQTKVIDSTETHSYLYDNTYQLTQDQKTGSKYNWVYDAVSNWDYVNLNDSLYKQFDIAAANKLNQYTTVDTAIYGYDDNGNLTSDGVYTYLYDAENRLLAVFQSGTPVVSYGYDALGRRVSKTVGTSTIKYCYDGDQVIAEYDGTGTLLRKFIYGPGIDEPICMIIPSGATAGTYFYHQDALGSVVALSQFENGVASFVEKYSYSAFGETTVTLNGSTGNPYRFTGREYEPETGLYYYRARFYNPQIGRFLQTDPIGYADSMNLYAYVGNNPTNFVDPSGLCKSGYGVGASLSGFGDAIAGRIDRFMKTSVEDHLKNLYNGLYNFGAMVDQSLYDIGANPGIISDTLYDFGYHSNEIFLNDIANKTDYELGGMVGNLTVDAEIAIVTARAVGTLGRYDINIESYSRSFKAPQVIVKKDGNFLMKSGLHPEHHGMGKHFETIIKTEDKTTKIIIPAKDRLIYMDTK